MQKIYYGRAVYNYKEIGAVMRVLKNNSLKSSKITNTVSKIINQVKKGRDNSLLKLSNKYGLQISSIHPLYFDSFYVSLLSSKYKYNSSKLVQSFIIGLYSNLIAKFKTGEYSSLIYVLKKAV